MTIKYGLPIVTVRWADCDSGTPIFWSLSFLGERGCDVLQVGRVGTVISLHSPSVNDWRPKWDCVFLMSQRFENRERVMIKVERQSKWQRSLFREHSVKVKLFSFFFFWRLVPALFIYLLLLFLLFLFCKKLQILYCLHGTFVVLLCVNALSY